VSAHLRNCPKHRRPLPCSHCAMVQTAAPVVAEPIAVPVAAPPERQLASQVYREKRDATTGAVIDVAADYKSEMGLAQAHKFFGIKPKPEKKFEPAQKPMIESYRVLLGLDHAAVADVFDRPVGNKIVTVTEMVLMDRQLVEQQKKNLQAEIAELKKLIDSRSVHMQKLHRPDDILPKADRERLKREERAELSKKDSELRVLHVRLFHWEKDPRNYVQSTAKKTVELLFGEAYPITHVDKTVEHGWYEAYEVGKRGGVTEFDICGALEVPVGGVYDVEGYRKLITLDAGALEQMSGDKNWRGWMIWENKVIEQAIRCGFFNPPEDIVKLHTGLNVWIPPDHPDDDDHEHERNLISKTGSGLGVGTRIYSRGWQVGKHGNRQRPLESFDETARGRGVEKMSSGEPDSFEPDANDDTDSYEPD